MLVWCVSGKMDKNAFLSLVPNASISKFVAMCSLFRQVAGQVFLSFCTWAVRSNLLSSKMLSITHSTNALVYTVVMWVDKQLYRSQLDTILFYSWPPRAVTSPGLGAGRCVRIEPTKTTLLSAPEIRQL